MQKITLRMPHVILLLSDLCTCHLSSPKQGPGTKKGTLQRTTRITLYNNNNIYPGSPLALAVFSGALQIINDKMTTTKTTKNPLL